MLSHARVVVIGGGVMGCSLLYHLTRLGWVDVVLVEKNELTAGSTWHAAGLCTHFAHSPSIMQMRAHSVQLYRSDLTEETGSPVSFHQCGALRVTRSTDRMDEFCQVQGLGRYAGFDFHILTPAELSLLYPLASLDKLLGAIYEPDDGYVDPSQATHAMAAGARSAGATIYRHNPVESIERSESGEWHIHTRNGEVVCETIVNAAGTWSYEVGKMMGIELPIVPMLHQYLVTDAVPALAELDRELPIIRDPEESWYVRQERDGFIIGPYEREGEPWSIDGVPPDFGMELLPPALERVEDIVVCAVERVPTLAEAGIKSIVNGPITFTPDAGPLVGPAFGLCNAWLLTGSSMGVMEGGGAGRFLAEWIVGDEPPMDALAVDPRRFGAFADRDYRIARAIESFGQQFGIHYPYEERPAGRPKRMTPIHGELEQRGAVFGAAYGWERPNWFAPPGQSPESTLSFRRANWFDQVGAECCAVRDSVGLADMSAFSKFEICGAGAETFIASLGANRAPPHIGDIALTHVLTPSGGILSEFTITRLGADRYYLISAAAAERQDLDLLRSRSVHWSDLSVRCVTAEHGVLSVMGPQSRHLLARLTDADLGDSAFPWFTCQTINVAGVPVCAMRVSYVGELGWELHHPMLQQPRLFAALVQESQSLDATLFGAFAMNSMRLEKGYRAWGLDLTTERTPLEAGLGSLVKLDDRDFIGRSALIERSNTEKHMALLEISADGPDPFYLHPVFADDQVVGLVTSGTFGHRTQKKLALAYLDYDSATIHGKSLMTEILGEHWPTNILDEPPYDPGNRRIRA